MKDLHIRTRANTAAFGKTKVYIVGSDKGVNLYLKRIEDTILSAFNCAIYHGLPGS